MWVMFHQTTRLEVKRHFHVLPCISHPFAPPRNALSLHQKPPFISSTCTVSLCCLWISLLPQFISTWRSFWHISSWHLTTYTSGRLFFGIPPRNVAKPKTTVENWGKSPQKVEPANQLLKMYGYGSGMFWFLFFFILNHGQVCHFWRYFCALFYDLWGAVIPKKGHTCQLKTRPTRTLQSLHMSYYNISFVYLLSFHYICGYKYTEYSVYS